MLNYHGAPNWGFVLEHRMKRIAVLLAEDHTIVRQGLKLLIEADGDIVVVGEAKTGREAVQMTRDLCPELVVMDIAMPLLNGVQATRQILEGIPGVKVLILSAHSDAGYVEQVAEMGASGYPLTTRSTFLSDFTALRRRWMRSR